VSHDGGGSSSEAAKLGYTVQVMDVGDCAKLDQRASQMNATIDEDAATAA
jgi:hypothetical protein